MLQYKIIWKSTFLHSSNVLCLFEITEIRASIFLVRMAPLIIYFVRHPTVKHSYLGSTETNSTQLRYWHGSCGDQCVTRPSGGSLINNLSDWLSESANNRCKLWPKYYQLQSLAIQQIYQCPFFEENDIDVFLYNVPVFVLLTFNTFFLVWIMIVSKSTTTYPYIRNLSKAFT